jgi:hypothetical protein
VGCVKSIPLEIGWFQDCLLAALPVGIISGAG